MNEDDLSVPIHQSLLRPLLVMGGERQLVLMLGVISGVMIISLAQLWSAILGISMWVIGQYFLSRAAEYDADLSKTGIRHLRYKKHYPAASTPFAGNREIQ